VATSLLLVSVLPVKRPILFIRSSNSFFFSSSVFCGGVTGVVADKKLGENSGELPKMEEEKGEVEGVVVDNGVVVWNKELPPKVSVIRDSKAFLPVSGAGVVGDDRRDEPAKREELENKPLPNKLPRPPESEDFLVSSSFFFISSIILLTLASNSF